MYKPDADNLAKFVLDALNGTYYKDDSQICLLYVEKKYGDEDSVKVSLTCRSTSCTGS
jgi:Holliday junction resolvase RusA-like endonuclease